MNKKVLNVGGGPSRDLPPEYAGWDQQLLDIDPAVKPDIVCDARKMSALPAAKYDAIFCSHTLEHFHKHEVPEVLRGFLHVLKADGFAQIAVPDMAELFELVRTRDIDDVWYVSPGGPITFHDVIYGWGRQVERGNLFYCHKTGFTERSLSQALSRSGFKDIRTARDSGNLHAFAFKTKPKPSVLRTLGVL